MSWYCYLDDTRPLPKGTKFEWVAAKSLKEFKALVERKGVPKYVTFDHDLNEEHYDHDYSDKQTGLDAIEWLLKYCKAKGVEFPLWSVHTMNVKRGQDMKNLLHVQAGKQYLPCHLDLDPDPDEVQGLRIMCVRCGSYLKEPGALIFSPPDANNQCMKFHFCKTCYGNLFNYQNITKEVK